MTSKFIGLFILTLLTACSAIKRYQALQSYEVTLASSAQKDTTVTDVTRAVDFDGRPAKVLSAFFGLDNELPRIAEKGVCKGAGGKDGMPVIFSHEIDVKSLQAGDFKVITASGKIGKITCVTLAPADDKGELRTALLAGEYGSLTDQPVKVEIVGNILSLDNSVNFKGQTVDVIKLEDGPTMIRAEVLTLEELGKKPTPLPWGGGSGCPNNTKKIVGVTWVGGVTKPGGDEADDQERLQYQVSIEQENGKITKVTPFALADLNDGDNNHRLCLDVEGVPKSVFFPAGYLTDPRDDLNSDTAVTVQNAL